MMMIIIIMVMMMIKIIIIIIMMMMMIKIIIIIIIMMMMMIKIIIIMMMIIIIIIIMMMMMMMMMIIIMMIIIIIMMMMMMVMMMMIIALKGAIRDVLQSPHCTRTVSNTLRSIGPGAIVCTSRAAQRTLITCNRSCATGVRRGSSAIKFDRVEIAFALALFYWLRPLTDEVINQNIPQECFAR